MRILLKAHWITTVLIFYYFNIVLGSKPSIDKEILVKLLWISCGLAARLRM